MTDEKYYVYALLDPRKAGSYSWADLHFDFEPFYIGKGCGSRIRQHVAAVKRNPEPVARDHKGNKIRKIIAEGMVPVEVKLFVGLTSDAANVKESALIAAMGGIGAGSILTNKTLGGDGTTGAIYTEERREKLRYIRSDEAKSRMREACRSRIPHKHTESSKEKIRRALRGREMTDEHRQRLSLAGMGRKLSAESIEKNRQSNLGKTHSQEAKEKMSMARKGVAKSPGHIEKIASAQRGKPRPQIACQHCGLMSSHGNIKRWHGDNCKKRSENAKQHD